jgi:hypothetical protein
VGKSSLDDPVNLVDPWGLSNRTATPKVTNSTVAGGEWDETQTGVWNNNPPNSATRKYTNSSQNDFIPKPEAPTPAQGGNSTQSSHDYTYSQSTGELRHANGTLIATGYSGYGYGKNNATAQNVTDVGPLPQGNWKIGPLLDGGNMGPNVRHLEPQDGNDVFNTTRHASSFYMHGCNGNGNASTGCLVIGPATRKQVNGTILVTE